MAQAFLQLQTSALHPRSSTAIGPFFQSWRSVGISPARSIWCDRSRRLVSGSATSDAGDEDDERADGRLPSMTNQPPDQHDELSDRVQQVAERRQEDLMK
jgi:hypothetical protein